MHGLLHPAEPVGQQRLHHQHGQVDAHRQQVGAEQHVQDGVGGEVDHRRTAAVRKGTGQQLLFQLLRLRALVPQRAQAAQKARQHPGRRQQQGHGHRQHHGVFARSGKDHQRSQTHALHHDRVVFENAVMVRELFGVARDRFGNMTSHSASSFRFSSR